MIGHDPTRTYRAAVIGAGSGGLTLAIGLAGFGHDVVLIEGVGLAETAATSDASRRRPCSTPLARASTNHSHGLGRSETISPAVSTTRWPATTESTSCAAGRRSSVDGIWAVGDVTGATLTTHGAGAAGRRAVRAIALPKLPKVGRLGALPNAVFGEPEVASVGMTLDELAAIPESSRRRIVVDHADVDRGFTDDISHGRLVIDVERFTGRILRAAIVGPGASDLIGMLTMAIDNGITLRKLCGMVHPYPSHAEIIRQAADEFALSTLPNLPREWTAMARGRISRRTRR